MLYSEQFCFLHWGAKIIFRFISIQVKLDFGILHDRAYCVVVYTTKNSRIGHCIFFLTDYIQSNFAFNIGVPR